MGYCPARNVSTMLVHQFHVISRHIHHSCHHQDSNRLPPDYERNTVSTRPCLECGVVMKSKSNIVVGCSKFQIGALPGHRSQEHLFSLKSVISLYEMLKISLIISFFDVSKFFDKESLRDALDKLYKAGIVGKLYRLWYEINKNSTIQIKTGSADTGENLQQGSNGGALASALNLDSSVNDFFQGSESEVSYAEIRLSPLIFQDDIARIGTTVEGAQAANDSIATLMNLKQLHAVGIY